MSFSIKIQDQVENNSEKKECLGGIVIDDFQEKFVISLDYWSVDHYKRHDPVKQIV